MTSTDIRDHYDIKDPYDGDIVYDILTLYPPRFCSGTTGIDSLAAVMRRIYAHAMIGDDGIAQDQWFKDAEKENPILKYAWELMGNGKEDVAAAQLVRAETIKKIGGKEPPNESSFKELCTSEMMNKTFWSQGDFCLYYPVYSWATFGIIEQSPTVKATESIVIMDRIESPEITLQQAVSSKFGDFNKEESGDLYYRPSQPVVIRVLLRTNGDINNNPGNRLFFKELQRFQMPQQEPRQVENGWILVDGVPLNYTIAAVVKLREVETGDHPDVNQQEVETEDKVRTYAPNRFEIIPSYEDTHLMSTRWSVEDQRPYPMEYMLFYIRFKPEATEMLEMPEEQGRAPAINVQAWEAVTSLLNEEQKRFEAAKAKTESQPQPQAASKGESEAASKGESQAQSQAESAQSNAGDTSATTGASPEASRRSGRQRGPMTPQDEAFNSRKSAKRRHSRRSN